MPQRISIVVKRDRKGLVRLAAPVLLALFLKCALVPAFAQQPSGKGPQDQVGDQVPFNGYLFRILTSQGSHAPDEAKNYIVDGKMIAGFAFVAYPVEHRSSGVMTFMVNESGTIYEKDLGPDTTRLAEAMTAYDPDSTWRRVK